MHDDVIEVPKPVKPVKDDERNRVMSSIHCLVCCCAIGQSPQMFVTLLSTLTAHTLQAVFEGI